MFNDLSIKGNRYTEAFHAALKRAGVTHATGVPCGELRYFIHSFDVDPQITHLPALNEREAIGLAAGVWLAGKRPIVYMQNSGLFVASKDIASLLLPRPMGIPLLVSYRGCPGETAPQHVYTGAHTKGLLDGLGMLYLELEEVNAEEAPGQCVRFADDSARPAVILVKRGWTDLPAGEDAEVSEKVLPLQKERGVVENRQREQELPLREEVLSAIAAEITARTALISSPGLISRSLFERHDGSNQFYNTGGFGLTSAIGLGFAVARPEVPTVVVEGDASCLTNFGNLVSIAHWAPKNFVHVVVDNGAYESCSGEPSLSTVARFAEAAALFGYRRTFIVDTVDSVKRTIQKALAQEGPVLIHVKVGLGGRRDLARPLEMTAIARRFQSHFH